MAENIDEPGWIRADAERDRVASSDTEVADLVKTLRSYGAHAGTVARTLRRAALAAGPLHRRSSTRRRRRRHQAAGAGLFEVGPDAPDPNEGRFDPP
jgi:hypothetical protein